MRMACFFVRDASQRRAPAAMVCLAAMVSQKRKLRRQRLRRHLSSTLEHLRRYWHYKSVNDRENQAAGKHIPPSGDRRIGARGGWRFAEYCRDVYLDFFPDGALWDEDDLPLFNFDIDASATRWFYTACLDGDASVNQSHPNRVFKRFPEIAAHNSVLKSAVLELKQQLHGFASTVEASGKESWLYDPFAHRGGVFMAWNGYASGQDYARRSASIEESARSENGSRLEAREFLKRDCVRDPHVKGVLATDGRLRYVRIHNSFDPVVGADVWNDHRGDSINVITSCPYCLTDLAFAYFSKRVTHFAAFLIPERVAGLEEMQTEAVKFFFRYVERENRLGVIPCGKRNCRMLWIIIFKNRAWRSKLLHHKYYGWHGGAGPGRPKVSTD